MVPDIGEGLAILFAIIAGSIIGLPILGFAVGALTAWKLSRISWEAGAGIGFLCGGAGIGLLLLMFWVIDEMGWKMPPYEVRMTLIVALPLAGPLLPIPLLLLINWRTTSSKSA